MKYKKTLYSVTSGTPLVQLSHHLNRLKQSILHSGSLYSLLIGLLVLNGLFGVVLSFIVSALSKAITVAV